MGRFRCPGQDTRNWSPDDLSNLACPGCGASIEFWKDDYCRVCRQCGKKVRNPKFDPGCAKWCESAAECLGAEAAVVAAALSLRDRLITEMKTVLGDDQRRIKHALDVLGYAEQIQDDEGGDPLVVKAAAILHDIGIHEAERKHGSSSGRYQEIEGPPIAQSILDRFGVKPDVADHVCRIVGSHHSARDIDTLEFRIVWDADWLVNIPEEHAGKTKEDLAKLIARVFRTATGRRLAEKMFLEME